MKTPRVCAAVFGALFLPAVLAATVSQRIPVVTQVQGVVFYRTFLMIGVASGSPTAIPTLTLTYRSPVDGTVQSPALTLATAIGGGQAQTFEDVIQTFKDAGSIRTADLGVGIFGTLTVTADALSLSSQLSVVARTYSPATGGGTNGIAYIGRDRASSGSMSRVTAFVRNGTFGLDGTTRANVGLVNEGPAATDVRVTYLDAGSGVKIKEFNLSSTVGHALNPGEVVQLNNIFAGSGVPTSTRLINVQAVPLSPIPISGYAVQLDSVTNDGSFFLMTEEPSH
jgi:hypothetical protein